MAGTVKKVLVTGASGQLGGALVKGLVEEGYRVRALVHRRPVGVRGVECVLGDVTDMASVRRAMKGVEAVCQLATTKEDREGFIDVSVRGTYHLLEAARETGRVRRWILAGGDAAMGIYYRKQPVPIHEGMRHNAYPGVYALSKVLEEVLGEQFYVQYGVPYVCLRASWILHGDMILRHMMTEPGRVKVLTKKNGRALVRHVVGLQDVVQAFLLALKRPEGKVVGETFHIAGPSAFAYDEAGAYLAGKIGAKTIRVKVPEAHDFRIDISKAKRVLGYRPRWGIERIIDDALAWRRSGSGSV